MPKGERLHGNEVRGGTGHAEGRSGKEAGLGEREEGRGAGRRGARRRKEGVPQVSPRTFAGSLAAWNLRVRRRGAERPAGPAAGEPLPRGAEPLLSLPPAAPRAGRLLGAHHHVHQLVAHVRRHRRRRWPPGAAAAAAAAASGGDAQPPAGTGPAPPGAPRRGRSPGGLHQRPGAQGEHLLAALALGVAGDAALPRPPKGAPTPHLRSFPACPPCGGGPSPGAWGALVTRCLGWRCCPGAWPWVRGLAGRGVQPVVGRLWTVGFLFCWRWSVLFLMLDARGTLQMYVYDGIRKGWRRKFSYWKGKSIGRCLLLAHFVLGNWTAQMTFSSSSWEAEVGNHSLHSRNWGHFFNGKQNYVLPLERGITRLDCQTAIPVYQRQAE